MNQTKIVLKRQEVADLLKITPRTVQRMEKAGLLKPLKAGRIVRYLESDVLAAFPR